MSTMQITFPGNVARRDAILRAADQSTVKRHIVEPPSSESTAVPAGRAQLAAM